MSTQHRLPDMGALDALPAYQRPSVGHTSPDHLLTSLDDATTVAVLGERVFVSTGDDQSLTETPVTSWMSFGTDGTLIADTPRGELYIAQPDAGLGAALFAGQSLYAADTSKLHATVSSGTLVLGTRV